MVGTAHPTDSWLILRTFLPPSPVCRPMFGASSRLPQQRRSILAMLCRIQYLVNALACLEPFQCSEVFFLLPLLLSRPGWLMLPPMRERDPRLSAHCRQSVKSIASFRSFRCPRTVSAAPTRLGFKTSRHFSLGKKVRTTKERCVSKRETMPKMRIRTGGFWRSALAMIPETCLPLRMKK